MSDNWNLKEDARRFDENLEDSLDRFEEAVQLMSDDRNAIEVAPLIAEQYQERWFDFLCRKYVQRAEARHREMGLQYTEAETHDLAKECARFASILASSTDKTFDADSGGKFDEFVEKAAKVYGFVCMPDPVSLFPEQLALIGRIAAALKQEHNLANANADDQQNNK